MSHRPLRVAIIGVGGIALEHMKALRNTPEAELVAVFDLDQQRAKETAHIERCAVFSDLGELLNSDTVDAVIVCTPNMTHADIGRQALDAGKHVLMEKPMAMTYDGAAALAARADELGLTLAVGHSHRFSDQGLAIKAAIDNGEVGTPRFIRIVFNGGWIWPGWQAWVLNPELSGGHSLHNGVHLTDLASWWLGEAATSVFSVGQKATSAALDIYDYLVIELGFASGATAICEVSRAENPKNTNYAEITVVGSEGVLTREWDAQGLLAWTDSGFAAWSPTGAGDRTFITELNSFVAATRNEAPVVPPLADALHAVAVAEASEQSLKSKETIQLDAPNTNQVVLTSGKN